MMPSHSEVTIKAIKALKSALKLPDETRQQARERLEAEGIDEASTYQDWFEDVSSDQQRYKAARRNIEGAYLKYVEERCERPFQPSQSVVRRVVDRLESVDIARLLATWKQEIAWAERMRLSDEDAIVLMAHAFLKKAKRSPSQEFDQICTQFKACEMDEEYMHASEHRLSPEQIRMGSGNDGGTFIPLWLRIARQQMLPRLKSLPDEQRHASANRIRDIERDELDVITRKSIATSLANHNFLRMTGIISTALNLGMSSNDLHAAKQAFVTAVEKGEIRVGFDEGLPYTPFLDWIRVRGADGYKVEPADCKAEIFETVTGSRGWLENLPDEYEIMGAKEAETLYTWLNAILNDERPEPIDLILDYGFFLVDRSQTRRPT